MTLSLDVSEFRGGLDSFVADEHQDFVEVKAILKNGQQGREGGTHGRWGGGEGEELVITDRAGSAWMRVERG